MWASETGRRGASRWPGRGARGARRVSATLMIDKARKRKVEAREMSDRRTDGRDGGPPRPAAEEVLRTSQGVARGWFDKSEQPTPDNVLSYERGRLRQTLPRVASRCMSFSAMTCFDTWLVAAVYRFYGLEVDVATAEAEILEDEGERIRFFPWFLWDFRADDATETIGERFVLEAELPPHELELAVSLIASYIGFFEVTARQEAWVEVLDLAAQTALRIPDEALAADVKPGQLIHGRVVRVSDDEGLIDAVYAVLPSDAKPAVLLELETLIGDGGRPDLVLKAYAPEMLDFSDHLLDALTQPPAAENRDGDEIVSPSRPSRPRSGRAWAR